VNDIGWLVGWGFALLATVGWWRAERRAAAWRRLYEEVYGLVLRLEWWRADTAHEVDRYAAEIAAIRRDVAERSS
jgi:hypothetical protein